ncbi:MAG: 3-deoxy-D-manno-octulosonic acid transferase [Acetobacteraceae bacterium]|nr:3-deoxy-D-manno-octulosonic acid transferase [Acetobacteraceae bacterium]
MLARRLRRGKEIPGRLLERRGIERCPRPEGPIAWVHAASVGETASILPVIEKLGQYAPDLSILLTTGTVTSAHLLEARFADPAFPKRVLHRFMPLDVPRWTNRFLDHWRPSVAAFTESELWPNMLHGCRARGIPALLINGRMSARSYAGWRRLRGFAREILESFASVQARTEQDACRFRALGAQRVVLAGDLKFASAPLPVDETELAELRSRIGARPVWTAASTHPGEEDIVAQVHGALAVDHPDLLTIIVPRHPARAGSIRANLGSLRVSLRSAGEPPPDRDGIWIADTIGELGLFYRVSQVVFVGRSLKAPGGGQNPLEAARLGCAIAVGPWTQNFAEAVQTLAAAGALTQVQDAASLGAWVGNMLGDASRRAEVGSVAAEVSRRYADLPEKAARELLALMK